MQLSTSGDPFQPPLWQRSVKEELPAATMLGCTAVTGLTKTERPPGLNLRSQHSKCVYESPGRTFAFNTKY